MPSPARVQALDADEVDDTDADDADDDLVVTAQRHDGPARDAPYAISILGGSLLRFGPDSRSLPNALAREPSVLMQKTGPGQTSPYVRGFTGFHTLLMVDGVRLNNSVWRAGPNQYFGLVDNHSVDRVELVRGPSSVLWGSDAVGGTVNAITTPAQVDQGWQAIYAVRWSSAERSLVKRIGVEGGEEGRFALKAGYTGKHFGNIHAGGESGDLPGTSYDESAADVRLDIPLRDDVTLTMVGQRVRQRDVPRIHTTVEAVPFHNSSPGTELRRNLEQERDLVYGRLRWDDVDDMPWDEAALTLSYQRHREVQDRLRTGARLDLSGFDVETHGFDATFMREQDFGLLTWGVDAYRDEVDSFREDFVAGVSTGPQIQGPVGDDASYDTYGVFAQQEIVHAHGETTLGVRWSQARARADGVDDPNVPGSDPSTPGNVLEVDGTWRSLVGSVRHLVHVGDDGAVWGGLSQGYRAPNLSDLTSDLENSGQETPSPDLDEEHFLQFELGARKGDEQQSVEIVFWHTWVRDLIVRSPTGEFVGPTPVFRKDNVGDGRLYGVELKGSRRVGRDWTLFASASAMASAIDQFLADGTEVEGYIDREMPPTAVVGATWAPEGEDYHVTGDVLMSDDASHLSERDKTDLQRIPPGGTPGYAVLGLRTEKALSDRTVLGVGLENLLNKDYRVHGSGQNEPGRSLVVSLRGRL